MIQSTRRTRRPRDVDGGRRAATLISSSRPSPRWRRSSPRSCRAGSSPPRPRTGGRAGTGRRCRRAGSRPISALDALEARLPARHVRLAQVHPARLGPGLHALRGDLEGVVRREAVRASCTPARAAGGRRAGGWGCRWRRSPRRGRRAGHQLGRGRGDISAGVRVAHARPWSPKVAPQEVGLEEQLGEARRPEVLEGHAAHAVLVLQLAQLLQRPVPHEARPIGGAHAPRCRAR